LHEGQYETKRYVRFDPKHNRILVVRLWKTDMFVQKQQSELPLWAGEVSYLERIDFGPIQYLKTADNFDQALQEFEHHAIPLDIVMQHHAGPYQILLMQTGSDTNDNAYN
jgi:hypothetical protein